MSEADLLATVEKMCKLLGYRYYHTRYSKGSVPGFPDLVIVGRQAIIYRELKTAKGKTTMAQDQWLRDLSAVGQDARHAREHLEDLALLGLANRGKTSDAVNAHDTWEATADLRALWPEVVPVNTPHPLAPDKGEGGREASQDDPVEPPLFVGPTLPCSDCGEFHERYGEHGRPCRRGNPVFVPPSQEPCQPVADTSAATA